MSHTPLPWRLMKYAPSGGLLAQPQIVVGECKCKQCGDGLTVIAIPERDGDAELIVRAVNCHHDFLAACKQALMNLMDRQADDGETGDLLRAAIARATEATK